MGTLFLKILPSSLIYRHRSADFFCYIPRFAQYLAEYLLTNPDQIGLDLAAKKECLVLPLPFCVAIAARGRSVARRALVARATRILKNFEKQNQRQRIQILKELKSNYELRQE